MTTSVAATLDRRHFSASDIETLQALQATPNASGWAFNFDADETWDLITIQPPTRYRAHDPLYISPAVAIIPSEVGSGVLMSSPDGHGETAYASLAEALRDVGPRRVSWKRALR